MGFFGGGNDNNSNELLQQQLDQSNAETARKAHNLFDTRINLIKSQGSQMWNSAGMAMINPPRKDSASNTPK